MSVRHIAGHQFPEFGPCSCGIHWVTIRNATEGDLNQPGIAHTGNLTQHELSSIVEERDREDNRIAGAMGDLATGSGHTIRNPIELTEDVAC